MNNFLDQFENMVISDIDGTLLHEGAADSRTKKTLLERPIGHAVCYSTGSRLSSLIDKMGMTGLPMPDLIAVENGARLFIVTYQGLQEDLEWSEHVLGPGGSHYKELRSWISDLPYAHLVQWKDVIGIIPVEVMPTGGLERMLATKNGCALITVNTGSIEITPSSAGKHGVQEYLRQVTGMRIIAMGDGENDAEMLRQADYAMTFQGAHSQAVAAVLPKVADRSGYITPLSGHLGTVDLLVNAYNHDRGMVYGQK